MQGFRNLRVAYSPLAVNAANQNSTPWNILWGTVFYHASEVVVPVPIYKGSYATDFGGDFCHRRA